MRPLRVFLCHSSNDKPTVRELYQKLRVETWIEPWLDEEELYPGQDWNMEIEKAVETADVIIVCLSKGSITKEGYVQRELRTVLDFADYKPEGTLYIIPVRLEECEPPRRLRAWQYADYFKGERDRAYQRLLVSLKRRADGLGLAAKDISTAVVEKPIKEPNKIPIWVGGLLAFAILAFVAWKMSQLPASPEVTQTPVPTLTLGIGSTMIGEKGETLVYVPAGEFTMGDGANDAPIHTVYLDAFWIDQTEVTNKQYKVCVDAGTCEPPDSMNSFAHPSYFGNPEFDNYPVLYVNWDKANRYCEVWKGGDGDLPTEAQWEKAARGTDARTYPWGSQWDVLSIKRLNFSDKNDPTGASITLVDDGYADTAPVGSYLDGISPYGAYDMAGNVWEWVNDWYGETYYKDTSSSNNPVGPETGQYRGMRGGSWDYYGNFILSAYRGRNLSSYSSNRDGFRCIQSP